MLTAAPAGFAVGYVFQAAPFQCSIMVLPQSVVPTAQASDGEIATTPSRASRKAGGRIRGGYRAPALAVPVERRNTAGAA